MSLIRLRSREQARIKPRLIRNRVYGIHTIASRNDTAFQPFCSTFRCLFVQRTTPRTGRWLGPWFKREGGSRINVQKFTTLSNNCLGLETSHRLWVWRGAPSGPRQRALNLAIVLHKRQITSVDVGRVSRRRRPPIARGPPLLEFGLLRWGLLCSGADGTAAPENLSGQFSTFCFYLGAALGFCFCILCTAKDMKVEKQHCGEISALNSVI